MTTNQPPANLCRLPWTGFSNDPDGRTRPCCLYKDTIKDNGDDMYVQKYSTTEIFKSKYMQDLRQQFRDNLRPSACSTCWIDEKNGYESKRQRHMNDVNYIRSNNLEIDWESDPAHPVEFQMIISNSCNLKCRSCAPSHSSQWQQENVRRLGASGYKMIHEQSGNSMGKLWTTREEWYANLKRLEIVGGEPFYVKQWHQVFNELIDSGKSKDVCMSVSTNCTLIFPELVHKICKNFKSVGIGLSIDGMGGTYEYLRHPGKWDIALHIIAQYYDIMIDYANIGKVGMQLSYTVSWLNALELPKMHALVSQRFPQLKIWNNLVHYPENMALWAIPTELKNAIATEWDKYVWDPQYTDAVASMKTYMYSKNITDDAFIANLEKFREIDAVRGEDLLLSIPALAPYISKYWNK